LPATQELGKISEKLGSLSQGERRVLGQAVNEFKRVVSGALVSKESEYVRSSGPRVDLTLPGIPPKAGHLHPLTQFMRRVVGIFERMGYEVLQGPEVETEEYNFDLLNVPKDHPARDMHDTFWLRQKVSNSKSEIRNPKLLLRTHTSSVQLRAMLAPKTDESLARGRRGETRKSPVRLIVPGRVFRHEATDAGHETTFYQCEGLVIDKGIRVTDLFGTLKTLLQEIFGSDVKMRIRPHYYPFVEPGFDIDIACLICHGRGCSVCKQSGWLEMLGSGMVHPQVLRNMKIDPRIYSGFAFGLGIDRFMMLYYGVNDVRLSYSGDLRFVRQF